MRVMASWVIVLVNDKEFDTMFQLVPLASANAPQRFLAPGFESVAKQAALHGAHPELQTATGSERNRVHRAARA